MAKRQNLNRLVAFIGDLLDQEEHDWLIDKLLRVIEQKAPVEEIAKHAVIKNIHEYCVEDVIQYQAGKFYEDFRIEELKPQLIHDFIKMEHERRRDNFEDFCLHMYQQVEGIVNFIFEKEIEPTWESTRGSVAVLEESHTNKKFSRPKVGETVAQLIGFDENNGGWHAMAKAKAVLFFKYYKGGIKRRNHFTSNAKLLKYLYYGRNKVHRGGQMPSYIQRVYDEIKGKEYFYYLKFYGFLEDFISTINQNLPEPAIKRKPKGDKAILLADEAILLPDKAIPSVVEDKAAIPAPKKGPDEIVK